MHYLECNSLQVTCHSLDFRHIFVPALCAVRLLLHLSFLDYVFDPRVRRVLVQEENQAVVYVLKKMVSASQPMIVELKKLEILFRVLLVNMESSYTPSAFNHFSN